MSATVRWNTVRLERNVSRALAKASSGSLESQYDNAAKEVATIISGRIRQSGRGGDHNDEFAAQQTRVFRSAAGRYNVLLGWLDPPAHAHERGQGGKLWYQYQDMGFHLFAGPIWIEGIGATIDRREMLMERIEDINSRYVRDLAKTLEA